MRLIHNTYGLQYICAILLLGKQRQVDHWDCSKASLTNMESTRILKDAVQNKRRKAPRRDIRKCPIAYLNTSMTCACISPIYKCNHITHRKEKPCVSETLIKKVID